MVREALASYVYPSGVKKKPVLVTRPAQVGEKVAFVQVVAGLKDNGRKKHQEKGSRRKFLHVLDLVVGK